MTAPLTYLCAECGKAVHLMLVQTSLGIFCSYDCASRFAFRQGRTG
jgi:DNA-directed RNA polymerase subunit RPC12/RpoP